ncbi:hypothetical protein [Sinorhizobium chiapasense]|uniref:N-acetyltransferase domain-containing protein n=1 Tax=Sinorhizobium chiapasense TaxID=501572 RepID=A0ABZ2B974_9HYPH
MSDDFYSIRTMSWKNNDVGGSIEFEIICCGHKSDGSFDLSCEIASLSGFILDLGYYPTVRDIGVFQAFDMRSGHAVDTFRVITKRRSMIKRVLPDLDMDFTGTFIHLEKLWVREDFRGNRLGLRLMREARNMFGRFGSLALLKAHPDGDQTSDDDCRRLARYYQSDRVAGFRPLSARGEPGWLVADWYDPGTYGDDTSYWSPAKSPDRC